MKLNVRIGSAFATVAVGPFHTTDSEASDKIQTKPLYKQPTVPETIQMVIGGFLSTGNVRLFALAIQAPFIVPSVSLI